MKNVRLVSMDKENLYRGQLEAQVLEILMDKEGRTFEDSLLWIEQKYDEELRDFITRSIRKEDF